MNKIKTISLLPILCGTLLCSKISYASEPIIGKEFLNIEDYKTFKPLNCKEETYFSIYSNENIKIKETQGWFWGSETKEYATKAIAIYKIATIEAAYEHSSVGYLPVGSTFEFETRISNSVEYSSEVALKVNNKISKKVSAEGNVYVVKALGSFEKETQNQISTKLTLNKTSSIERYTRLTIPITESGYYFEDLRATYSVYEVQEYSINNKRVERERRKSGLATDVFYDVKSTGTCTNISYVCEFVADCGRCLVKYNQNSDGTFSYAGPESNKDIIYI